MCLICSELQRKALTVPEATRNLREMRSSLGEEHAREVDGLIHEEALRALDDLLLDFDPFISAPSMTQDDGIEIEFDCVTFV